MVFREWVQNEVTQRSASVTRILESVAAATHISVATIKGVYRGQRLTKYPLAKRLSEHTAGTVSIKELCE